MTAQDSVETTGSDVPRRTVLKGAAWSLPVIALATAVPAAAASTCTAVPADYIAAVSTAITSMPAYTNVTTSGLPARRYAPGTVYFRSTITYNGPETLPAGAQIRLAFSLDYQRTWTFGISSVSGTGAAQLSGPTTASVGNTLWARQYTTTTPTLPGTTFIIDWWAWTATSYNGSAPYGLTYWVPPTLCDDTVVLGGSSVGQGASRTGPGTTQAAFRLLPYIP